MSPEICKAEQYGPHSDIWALGCIIYEMCAKAPPFNAKTHFDLIQKIKAGRYPAIPSCYSPDLAQVIAKCLQVAPHNRPDTAQLLNLPIVKLMRKEQEVVSLGQEVKRQRDMLFRREQEFEAKCSITRRDINEQLRREWEVKAQLEIERRVKLDVERRMKAEIESLQKQFQTEVKAHVEKALKKFPGRLSKSPRLVPRSSTPTAGPEEHSLLFPAGEGETTMLNTSTSTLGTASNFTSGTELSSLSLDDSTAEDTTITAKPAPKRRSRAPMTRAQTMAPTTRAVPASPMDVHMSEPSPAPPSLAPLQLSPRRNHPRNNIFAAAQEGARKWGQQDVPPSPTDSDWQGDFEEDDGLPELPSPTRSRSASGDASNPFKTIGTKLTTKPSHQRLTNVPSLAPNGTKPRPHSTVPVVTTSPSRPRARPHSNADSTSPVRKSAPKAPEYGLKSKKTEGMRIQALKNNGGTGFQGRTLVELQQARGIPSPAMSEDEGKKGMLRTGIRSPAKSRTGGPMSALPKEPSVWDPSDPDVPSPFMKRNVKMVI